MLEDPRCHMREFSFSQAAIREGRVMVLAWFLYAMAFGLAFALYISNFNIGLSLKAAGISFCWIGVLLAIEIPLLNWKQRRLKVLVYEDRLVRKCGKKEQMLFWKDITRIKTVEKKKGGLFYISLYRKRPRMAMSLHGFTEMEDLANLIKERASEGVSLQEKRCKLDGQRPFAAGPIVLIPTLVVMCVIASMGSKAMDIFFVSFSLLAGLCLLIFRPLTKFDFSLKWIELILAVVLLILGARALDCFLSIGWIP
ncbi:MAG: hypothetical protein JSW66_19305 [Phycisphaerales bacterium]|nr:MAG: hypothetical protein JSW66_19305 [Phycisphaerales bacterium]